MYTSGAAIVAVSAVAILCSTAMSSTIRDDKSDQDYQNLADNAAYSGVGKVFNMPIAGMGSAGSGTLIAPQWVLTAAHMVNTAAFDSTIGFSINNILYNVDSYTYYNSYMGTESGGDLALLHLSTPVYGVTYATLYNGPTADLLGLTGTYVGYGTTGTGSTGNVDAYGTKRAVQNVIDALGNQISGSWPTSTLISDFDAPGSIGASVNRTGLSMPLDFEGLIAKGDSGGAMFVEIDDIIYLAGVISFVGHYDGTPNSNYGDISGTISIADYASWITANVPEPASLAVMSLGGACLLFMHRRHA